MSVNAYKEVTISRKKCHESCKISMLGWAPIHTSQPLDGWTTINVRLYQRFKNNTIMVVLGLCTLPTTYVYVIFNLSSKKGMKMMKNILRPVERPIGNG